MRQVNDMTRTINWFALAAGIITLVVLVVSLYMPWWQLTLGNNFFNVYASPINTNFGLYGAQFTIPLIWAWNLTNIMLFTAGGIIMLVYSFLPTKSYSKELLGFSWKKPLYALISLIVGLIVINVVAGYMGASFPLMGSSNIDFSFPSFIPINATISVLVTTTFLLPFWLAFVAVALCIVARFYHRKLNPKPKQTEAPTTTSTPAQENSPPPPPSSMIS
jgi:hypothetical protein